MNTDTGRLYEFRPDPDQPAPKGAVELRSYVEALAREHKDSLTEDERALAADLARGAAIVPVSREVAQKVRLGERELARRSARRKAAREARRRQR